MNEQEKMKRKLNFIEQNKSVLKENILNKLDNNTNVAQSLIIILSDDRDIIEIKEYYKLLKITDKGDNSFNYLTTIFDILGILKSFLCRTQDMDNQKIIDILDSYIILDMKREEKNKILRKAI